MLIYTSSAYKYERVGHTAEINMVARDGNFYFIKMSLGTGF